MAGLFLLFCIQIGCAAFGKRRIAIGLTLITLLFCILMLLHHATSKLKILL